MCNALSKRCFILVIPVPVVPFTYHTLNMPMSIGLIREIPTLKPLNHFEHVVTSTQLTNAENFNLISPAVYV